MFPFLVVRTKRRPRRLQTMHTEWTVQVKKFFLILVFVFTFDFLCNTNFFLYFIDIY